LIIDRTYGFKLYADPKGRDFYQVISPSGLTMTNASGTKEEVISELKRWRASVDTNHIMHEVEDSFIDTLERA
jgi:hypothetical protein